MFGPKHLIAWTIEAAKQATCIDRIVVSTEDEEIASISELYGADVPFIRPAELSLDDTPSFDVVVHALERLPSYDWVLLLQPTSPLRTFSDIDAIWRLCQDHGAYSAASVTEVNDHPWWMYDIDNRGILQPSCQDRISVSRRQDLKNFYKLNGALYLAQAQWLLSHGDFIGSDTLGYLMPPDRSIDLDTPLDWSWGEFLINYKNG
jgi:CMP-N,N'-diacetyllegionaminic acid synthase